CLVESTRLAVRDAGSKCRIKRVHIEGDINRRLKLQNQSVWHMTHLNSLHTESPGLLPLMPVDCADADLHQSFRESFLHDPGKRTRVRVAISLQFIVQIRVSIKMQDTQ